ncbi:MAG: hypothetical protein PUJ93_06060 [Oscillospiraceae bacterium]|nr:hypothetical protein [Oscillospiraceae bacterium]MDY5735452.1 hypothetical protein [Oscillospiraceae bacterium]
MKDINDMIAESVPQPTPDEMKDRIRALNLIVLELNERIESLNISREAWVRKCEELAGKLEDVEARSMLENIKGVLEGGARH